MDTLTTDRLDLIGRFLETRYDALCAHLADDEGVRPLDVRDEADALVADVRAARRWSTVPAHLRTQAARAIREARAMWEREGRDVEEVRRHVAFLLPREHVAFALREAYGDAALDPVP